MKHDKYNKLFRGKNHISKACVILGENILEHDLIVGDTKTINKILSSRDFKEIVKIFQERHKEIYKEQLSLPGDRDLYKKYYYENHPDFKIQ